ncbi:hypothetical protein [Martelella mediterranea]|uniref:Uncharacterized protein n=1 Tax=Martelella mediterranea DSM 17316 TaxID=1122214 RepID=A0A1U9Z7Z3_9HYPH|nr:hypothetical protein [Martelella mediterranea]AQZ53750.1 hypothetical protein Mame_04458 [Martelella mediterranea DSM 17316]
MFKNGLSPLTLALVVVVLMLLAVVGVYRFNAAPVEAPTRHPPIEDVPPSATGDADTP